MSPVSPCAGKPDSTGLLLDVATLATDCDQHRRLGDRIVFIPSHNPPRDGGFKSNPPHGGPAGADVTGALQAAANAHLEARLQGLRRRPHAQALKAPTTLRHDDGGPYVAELDRVIDMDAIRDVRLHIGIHPMGGAGFTRFYAAIGPA